MRRAAVLVLLVLAVAGAPAGAAPSDGVLWGGEEHRLRSSLSGWLGERGARYELWARRHPDAAAWLEGRAVTLGPPAAPPASVQAPAPSPAALESLDATAGALLVLAGLGATLLVAAATVARGWFPSPYGARLVAHQGALTAAGAVLVISVAIAYALYML